MKAVLLLLLLALFVAAAAYVLFPAARGVVVALVPMEGTIADLVRESRGRPPVEGVVHYDLVYARNRFRDYRLDLYEPLAPYSGERPPLLVFFHGGSWIHGDKVTIRVVDRFLRRMRSAGYYIAAVNYTTSILRGLRGPVENATTALHRLAEWADRYGYDAHNMGLYGVSAGGHIALMAAAAESAAAAGTAGTSGTAAGSAAGTSAADAGAAAGSAAEKASETATGTATVPEPGVFTVSFVFAECAPTDLIGLRDGEGFGYSWLFRFFSERRLRGLSPIEHIDEKLPPVLLYHGQKDRTVHVRQSERYAEALRAAGLPVELQLYPEGEHAFLNLPDEVWYEQESRALEWFEERFREANRPSGA